MADVDRVVARAGQLGEQLRQAAGERLAADEVAFLRLALERLDNLGGGARADVGVDQRLLEPLPGRLVEVALEQRRLDLGGERLARLAHRVAQAAEETASAIRRAGVGRVFDGVAAVGEEELVPVPRHEAGRMGRSPPSLDGPYDLATDELDLREILVREMLKHHPLDAGLRQAA